MRENLQRKTEIVQKSENTKVQIKKKMARLKWNIIIKKEKISEVTSQSCIEIESATNWSGNILFMKPKTQDVFFHTKQKQVTLSNKTGLRPVSWQQHVSFMVFFKRDRGVTIYAVGVQLFLSAFFELSRGVAEGVAM